MQDIYLKALWFRDYENHFIIFWRFKNWVLMIWQLWKGVKQLTYPAAAKMLYIFNWPEGNKIQRLREGKTRRGRNHLTLFWYAPIIYFVPLGGKPLWLLHCSFKSPPLLCVHFKCCSTKYTTSASPKALGLELLPY